MTVLLRFAPSPTGPLHLGGLRTALYNHLFARRNNGKWILRIEDTDATRYVPGSVEGICSALEWAGIEYDYGPGRHGPHGPYFQSQRLDLYRWYSTKLIDSGHAYRCFCTPDKLSQTREKLARSGSNSTYDKACLHLTDEEVARRVRAGEKSVVRLNDGNVPSRQLPSDLVFGQLKDGHLSLPTDPILLKSDLFPTYHLASVVDDHEMGITHVLRGEEWLQSLALHLDLYTCLGISAPKFAHLPLLLNADGSKMSKRNGDVQVADYIKRGWEPEALLNWLALAGWGALSEPTDKQTFEQSSGGRHHNAPESTKSMTLTELIDEFDIRALTHRNTSLDPKKLEHINKNHLMSKMSTPSGLDELVQRALPLLRDAFPESSFIDAEYVGRVIKALNGRLTNLQDLPSLVPYLFIEIDHSSPVAAEAHEIAKNLSKDKRERVLKAVIERLKSLESLEDVGTVLREEQQQLVGISSKDFNTAIRHAISGFSSGPSVPEIIQILGLERALTRMKSYLH